MAKKQNLLEKQKEQDNKIWTSLKIHTMEECVLKTMLTKG